MEDEEIFHLLDIPLSSEDELEDDSDEDPDYVEEDLISEDDNSNAEEDVEDADDPDELDPRPRGVNNRKQQVCVGSGDGPQIITVGLGANAVPQGAAPRRAGVPQKRPVMWKRESLILTDAESSFSGNSDLPDSLSLLQTPYQFFRYFFPNELMENIIEQSNLYSTQHKPEKPHILTQEDCQKFLGICIFTSVNNNRNVRDYWNPIIGNNLVQMTMSLNKFEKIRASLHFNDNNKALPVGVPGHDKLFKIRPVIDCLSERFLSVPMEESLSIDEQICATKTRHHLKQYMKNKPHKWGYKLFVLCSVSGFAYKFEIYSGQENNADNRPPEEPDLGSSSNTVVRLARDIPKGKKHKLYFDNYYTSVPLMVYLSKQGVLALGTVRRNRIPECKLATEQALKKSPRGTCEEFVATVDGETVTSLVWKDNKCVHFLSTFVGAMPLTNVRRYDRKNRTYVEVGCPAIVKVYNKHMGGVDLLDSHIGRHRITLKSRKWYFRLFYHLLDMTVINAWLVYKDVAKKNPEMPVLTQKQFRIELAHCLCNIGRKEQKRGRPSNEVQQGLDKKAKRCPSTVQPPKDVRQDSTSHWPQWNSTRNRCKMPACKGFTYVSCSKCGVNLCFNKDKNCLVKFHTG